MTDLLEEKKNETADIENPEKNVTQNSTSTRKKQTKRISKDKSNVNSSTSFITYVAILVSLSALALSGWQFYQSTLQQYSAKLNDLESSQKLLDSRLVAQKNTFSELEPVITQITPTLNKLEEVNQFTQENNSRINSDLSILQQKLKRIESTTKEDWKLAEAEYLIRLANQRLLMEKDSIGATQMLINADEILIQLADPLLFNARRTLAKDIQTLKSTPSFDLEGIYLQLEALISLVQGLPQKSHSRTLVAIPEIDQENTPAEKALWPELWSTLKSLIIISHHNKPIAELLPPADYQQLILHIQLQINVAQLALLKQEATIYQTALEHVYQAVNEHFDIDSTTISSFLTSLTALQQINPSPELPLPRDSLVAIKEVSKLWHSTIDPAQVENK